MRKPKKAMKVGRQLFARVNDIQWDNVQAHIKSMDTNMTNLVLHAMEPYLSKPPRVKR